MFTRVLLLIAVIAFVGHNRVEGLQIGVVNRRSFVSKFVAGTTGAAYIASTTSSSVAWAAESQPIVAKVAGAKQQSSGGQKTAKSTKEETKLNEAEVEPTKKQSLLERMGLADVEGVAASGPTRVEGKKTYGGVQSLYGQQG
eukprot:CAMPEP_0194172010 /NCGR_PEP_ID=MMETSP0154-20130528/6548_1 /TAXON_ID=1049557 /ORGANISM="Thalassiothrix antarctica, Strain L6-D1" /LENGTH=141 /DNA_ID=CAMNT_0038884543 /DNA_START=45 /DNA_END=470 /DNA_ORIENTATION=-